MFSEQGLSDIQVATGSVILCYGLLTLCSRCFANLTLHYNFSWLKIEVVFAGLREWLKKFTLKLRQRIASLNRFEQCPEHAFIAFCWQCHQGPLHQGASKGSLWFISMTTDTKREFWKRFKQIYPSAYCIVIYSKMYDIWTIQDKVLAPNFSYSFSFEFCCFVLWYHFQTLFSSW